VAREDEDEQTMVISYNEWTEKPFANVPIYQCIVTADTWQQRK